MTGAGISFQYFPPRPGRVAAHSGLEREVEDAAGQHGPLHRIGRLAGFEHHLDTLDEAAEVVMGPPLLEIDQGGHGLGVTFDVDCDGEILQHARHQKRRRA